MREFICQCDIIFVYVYFVKMILNCEDKLNVKFVQDIKRINFEQSKQFVWFNISDKTVNTLYLVMPVWLRSDEKGLNFTRYSGYILQVRWTSL